MRRSVLFVSLQQRPTDKTQIFIHLTFSPPYPEYVYGMHDFSHRESSVWDIIPKIHSSKRKIWKEEAAPSLTRSLLGFERPRRRRPPPRASACPCGHSWPKTRAAESKNSRDFSGGGGGGGEERIKGPTITITNKIPNKINLSHFSECAEQP